jgi:hypothetical protein
MKPRTQIEVPGGQNAVTSARLKRSELASTFGAALFGGGLGLLVARYVADLTVPLLLRALLYAASVQVSARAAAGALLS